MKKINLLFAFSLISLLMIQATAISNVKTYPVPEALTESKVYKVKVNNQEVWTEHYISNLEIESLPDWFSEPYVRKPQEQHIASFTGTGKLRVEIEIESLPETVSIRPKSRNIEPTIKGNTLSFDWEGPGQLVVEVNELPPLYLFADPEEKDAPSPGDANVIYFGPGVHRPGYIEMKDNQTVYLAAGAVVYGGLRAKDASNLKVTGRGILDGNYEYRKMVEIENSKNITFDGVTIRNGRGWTNTLINCRDVKYDYVKVFGFGPSSDGINPTGSQRVRITNCFLRNTDDCVAIKALNYDQPVKDIHVAHNIMIGFAYADGVTIGFETNAESVSNVVVSDCDILLARGGSRVDGHSGFSIICDGPAVIHDILYEDIRVERSELKLFELNITNGTLYGEDPPGHIKNITVKNVHWFHEGPIIIHGFNENHQVKDVTFVNCRVAGKPLKSVKKKLFSINDYTANIRVK